MEVLIIFFFVLIHFVETLVELEKKWETKINVEVERNQRGVELGQLMVDTLKAVVEYMDKQKEEKEKDKERDAKNQEIRRLMKEKIEQLETLLKRIEAVNQLLFKKDNKNYRGLNYLELEDEMNNWNDENQSKKKLDVKNNVDEVNGKEEEKDVSDDEMSVGSVIEPSVKVKTRLVLNPLNIIKNLWNKKKELPSQSITSFSIDPIMNSTDERGEDLSLFALPKNYQYKLLKMGSSLKNLTANQMILVKERYSLKKALIESKEEIKRLMENSLKLKNKKIEKKIDIKHEKEKMFPLDENEEEIEGLIPCYYKDGVALISQIMEEIKRFEMESLQNYDSKDVFVDKDDQIEDDGDDKESENEASLEKDIVEIGEKAKLVKQQLVEMKNSHLIEKRKRMRNDYLMDQLIRLFKFITLIIIIFSTLITSICSYQHRGKVLYDV
jgi:hypothetical protein